jgi:hypothetical protein
MKMSLWTVLWGSFFILIGLNIFLKAFGVDLPIFRVLVALLIIWLGISILLPGKRVLGWCHINSHTGRETVFAESKLQGEELSGDYSVVFGSTEMDLTAVPLQEKTKDIHVNVVFGQSKIKIDKSRPLRVTGHAAFGGISTPGGGSTAFGTVNYATESYKEGEPHLALDVNAVFGNIEIE